MVIKVFKWRAPCKSTLAEGQPSLKDLKRKWKWNETRIREIQFNSRTTLIHLNILRGNVENESLKLDTRSFILLGNPAKFYTMSMLKSMLRYWHVRWRTLNLRNCNLFALTDTKITEAGRTFVYRGVFAQKLPISL